MADKMPIAVLISGRGRTLRNILDKIDANELDVKINLVIGSKNCYGLQFAEKKNIPTDVVESSQYSDIESFSEAVFAKCRRSMARYVVMAGYLSKLRIPQDFENRVLNIHPSLIPSFCGKGFYGRSVHEAALRQGVKVSGCTVHFVDNEYDHGPIILQKVVPVLEDDTTDTLSDRVRYDAECKAYPGAVQRLAEKKIQIETVEGVSGDRQIVRILK